MKNITPCAEWEKKLSSTHSEDLSLSERFELEVHIASCDICAKTKAAYDEMDTLLRNLPTTEPLSDLPPKLLRFWEEEDRQRLSSGDRPNARKSRTRKRTRPFQLPTLAHNGGLAYAFQRGTAVATSRRGMITAMATVIAMALLLLSYPLVFVSQHAAVVSQAKATAPALMNTRRPSATETATVPQASATATSDISSNFAALVAGGKLTIDDPLRNNVHGYRWNTFNGLAGGCVFSGGVYHAVAPSRSLFVPCLAQGTNFNDFALQVQMVIVRGDQGGIIFRSDALSGAFYAFVIQTDGSYTLETYNHYALIKVLQKGSTPAIRTGHNQPNMVAVVARGNNLDLFVNEQPVVSMSDSFYNHGQIGVFARSVSNLTDVIFSNVGVWLLT